MKKHGTRVWRWEMPWWNLVGDDARSSGAAFARAFLTTLEELRAGSVPRVIEQPTIDVESIACKLALLQTIQCAGKMIGPTLTL